ncbi:hypothetical protein EDB84DRAFT_1075144 [Lactarius hengduanensis]|nr:hypothetical protein EDB84DRAFT_1075144 [Lactarius hengduanensis]
MCVVTWHCRPQRCHLLPSISRFHTAPHPSIYHNIADYAAPLIPISPPHCPRFQLSLPTMIHHTFQPLPLAAPFASFSHLDQWTPSWPDVYVFSKLDPRLSRPHPYSSRRRPPYPRLEPTSGLSPRSPRTGSQPVLRTQLPPMLSALPIPVATLGLEPSPMSTSSNPGSPMSTAAPPTPAPEFLQVVCNAPLLAPKPLPYRPPAFLDSFELPDPDEDLSRPPYTRSSSKRKRTRTRDEQDDSSLVSKRRATESVFRGLNGLGSHRRFSK